MYDFSSNHFQFIQDFDKVHFCDFYSGLDGLSIYFVLVTTIITPIALLSNWNSIKVTVRAYVIIILLLETLLLAVFLLLDIFLFYVFFESILPPLFILIGLFGSNEKVRASFYLFLYTLKTGVGYHLFKCKRVKFRGNPKGLVTKAVEKIPGPARLITRGKVILLNMKETKWVIADLNQTVFVKEQRVDGSSIKYNGKVYSKSPGNPVLTTNF